jgi:PBP1b-binding outer membrane lipoprotein LpoB
MRRIIYAVFITILFTGCATNNRTNVSDNSWNDATLVAEQRLIIEQQQQRFDNMGKIIDEVQSDLGRAVDKVIDGLDGNRDLKSQFAIIDQFVRSVIESKRRLEILQSTDWTEDAGEG